MGALILNFKAQTQKRKLEKLSAQAQKRTFFQNLVHKRKSAHVRKSKKNLKLKFRSVKKKKKEKRKYVKINYFYILFERCKYITKNEKDFNLIYSIIYDLFLLVALLLHSEHGHILFHKGNF